MKSCHPESPRTKSPIVKTETKRLQIMESLTLTAHQKLGIIWFKEMLQKIIVVLKEIFAVLSVYIRNFEKKLKNPSRNKVER